jgi:hypothetical protein
MEIKLFESQLSAEVTANGTAAYLSFSQGSERFSEDVQIQNTGASDAYIAFGSSAIATVPTSTMRNNCELVKMGSSRTFSTTKEGVSFITKGASTTLHISVGVGA